jgi:hypothetical protein
MKTTPRKTNDTKRPRGRPRKYPKPEPKPAKVGRPSPYRKEFEEQAFRMCLLGATDKVLAGFFKISESTLNKWKHDFPEFSEHIYRGREEADTIVAASLYQRAKGFVKKDCEKVFQHKGEIVRARTQEYFPPDTAAIKFWLTNRHPELWKDKITSEHQNPDGSALKLTIETVSGETKKILRELEEKLSQNEGNSRI